MKATGIGTERVGIELSATEETPRAGEPSVAGVTLRHVLGSEWIKLRSVRSGRCSVAALGMSILLLGAFTAVGIVVKDNPPAAEAVMADPSGGALAGVSFFAQIAAITVGVLAVTGEYRNPMIRVSFAAVPRRLPLVWAKAGVVAAVTAIVSLVAVLLAFGISSVVVATDGQSLSLSEPRLARALFGAPVMLALTGVLATAVGWLVRSTAGAVSALVAVLYVLPSLAVALPEAVSRYLPNSAAAAVIQVNPLEAAPGRWTGLAVYAAYAAFTLAFAALAVRRRDA
ncbi:ABC transporter permease [Knoellia aerolata]|uniref:ABC transporter permease n=1 Tax=Knoellia aerolata DSM 18566 TaxID=1385519 RepID=A0A0A0JX98_9MICO|nr:ABC transporter permease [Knoellia aerolata]KGN40211.1 hypothetical protein N801_16215 [Knoellia aerolata DSM 18566]